MAQFFTDFSEHPVGSGVPSGWALAGTTIPTASIVADASAAGGKLLSVDAKTLNGSYYLLWNTPGAAGDVRIHRRLKFTGVSVYYREGVTACYTTAPGYIVSLDYAEMFLVRLGATVARVSIPPVPLNAWLELEVEFVAGGWCRARVWPAGTPAPAWQIEYHDPNPLPPGRFGLTGYNFGTHPARITDTFGVGTDGDPAPRDGNQRPTPPTLTHSSVTTAGATIHRTPGTDPDGDPITATALRIGTAYTSGTNTVSGLLPGYTGSSRAPYASLEISGLAPGTTYYYQGADSDAGGFGEWGVAGSFATPAIVRPARPTLDVAVVGQTVLLKGSDYEHPEGTPHAASQWQVDAAGGDFASPAFDLTAGPDTEISIADLEAGLSFSAHVRYQDAAGEWSEWSAPVPFQTEMGPRPSRPTLTLVELASEAAKVESSAYEHPDGVDEAPLVLAEYHFARTSDFSTLTARIVAPADPDGAWRKVNLSDLSPSTTYYGRVRHQDARGQWSLWSPPLTIATPALPVHKPSTPTVKLVDWGIVEDFYTLEIAATMLAAGYSHPAGAPLNAVDWAIRRTIGGEPVTYTQGGSGEAGLTTSFRVLPGETFALRARFTGGSRYGDWSPFVEFTAPIPQPRPVVVAPVGYVQPVDDVVGVQWEYWTPTPPGTVADIEYSLEDEQTWESIVTGAAELSAAWPIGNIPSGRHYTLRSRSRSETGGVSEWRYHNPIWWPQASKVDSSKSEDFALGGVLPSGTFTPGDSPDHLAPFSINGGRPVWVNYPTFGPLQLRHLPSGQPRDVDVWADVMFTDPGDGYYWWYNAVKYAAIGAYMSGENTHEWTTTPGDGPDARGVHSLSFRVSPYSGTSILDNALLYGWQELRARFNLKHGRANHVALQLRVHEGGRLTRAGADDTIITGPLYYYFNRRAYPKIYDDQGRLIAWMGEDVQVAEPWYTMRMRVSAETVHSDGRFDARVQCRLYGVQLPDGKQWHFDQVVKKLDMPCGWAGVMSGALWTFSTPLVQYRNLRIVPSSYGGCCAAPATAEIWEVE